MRVILLVGLLGVSFPAFPQSDTSKIVEWELVYSALPWVNTTGGLDQGFVYMGNLDLTGRLQLGRMFSTSNDLTLFAYGLADHGAPATDLMGDYQVASNIQAPQSWRLFEFWVQQNLFGDQFSLLAGLYDLNSEFDVLRPGTLFINSSFGIGADYAQSGKNGPSIFPVSSFGVRFAMTPMKRLKIKLALLDGVPGKPTRPASNDVHLSKEDGMLIAVESSVLIGAEYKSKSHDLVRETVTRRNKVGRYHEILRGDMVNAGGWYYTAQHQKMADSSNAMGNWGAYVGMQKFIFSRSSTTRYLSLFGRVGFAAHQFNRFGSAVSGGLVFSEILRGVQDYLGFAFSTGFNSAAFMEINPQASDSETAIEATYSILLANWLMLQPDIQYVINPNTRTDLKNPLSFALLIQFSL